ncbi:MAG: MGMT family protein [Acholeplasma sp.]|nr:MAG: MGMT family protein [Acholeplasma sp.]
MTIDDLDVTIDHDPLIEQIHNELDHYFHHTLHTFSIPIKFTYGTPFQHEVWQAMQKIPFGKTLCYQDIANEIHRPKALRAVGQACKRNPIGIMVPCHRVIGKDGSMTGYSGKAYVDLKRQLLDHEMGLSRESFIKKI